MSRARWRMEWRHVRVAYRYGTPELYGMPLDTTARGCFLARIGGAP